MGSYVSIVPAHADYSIFVVTVSGIDMNTTRGKDVVSRPVFLFVRYYLPFQSYMHKSLHLSFLGAPGGYY